MNSKNEPKSDEHVTSPQPMSRHDAIKAEGLAGAAVLSTVVVSPAQAAPTAAQAKNPYGGVPSGGITLPPYYRPTPNLASNNVYYPGQEELGPDEMRISFIGSTPIPVTRAQAGAMRPARRSQLSMPATRKVSLRPTSSTPKRCLKP
jgi:ribonuclease Z